MKKTLNGKKGQADNLKNEYRFDYAKAEPNRFATGASASTLAVVLDPDVAAVFKSSEAVNSFLRSIISAMPKIQRPRRKPGKR